MNKTHWKKIKHIFETSSMLPPEEREAFLNKECGDNAELRREVDELLALLENSDSFLEDPAVHELASLFEEENTPNGQKTSNKVSTANYVPGTVLDNRYRTIGLLGKGGMGEVYLAQDTKLNRKVAIKFLSHEFGNDADKLNRFVQEAQTASALNHPNIITIYEIGEFENAHYIVTEYIEGETLSTELKGKSQNFKFVLETGVQIASALDAAHNAGIVHRDIKPDNIIIRPDGLVKILDFGIAKLTEKQTPEVESEDAKGFQINTAPGVIIGTANYMSPEQAKGLEVDTRTDIFSFGVVLYEMVSGQRPFQGETPMDITASIIQKEPKPLEISDVPPEIERIISKTLRKERDERYQTIEVALADLNQVKQNLEFQEKLHKTIEPNLEQNQTQAIFSTTAGEQKQTTNITGESKRYLPKWNIASGIMSLVGIAIFVGWYFLAGDLFSKAMPYSKIKIEEITTAAKIQNPVISPDGKFIAYSKSVLEGQIEKESLIVRQTGSGAENVINETQEYGIEPQTFSPDGEFIFFLKRTRGDQQGLYKISSLGGSPKKILDGNIGNMSISPDGKKIAYTKRNDGDAYSIHRVIHLAEIDGSNSEEILNLRDVDALTIGMGNWYPDGTKLLIGIYRDAGAEGVKSLLATLDISSKDLSRKDRVEIIYEFVLGELRAGFWLPHGNGIILSILKYSEQTRQLWYLPYPEGEIRQITDDFNDYDDVRISSDGNSIIGTINTFPTSVWSVDPKTKRGQQVIPENKSLQNDSLSNSADGRIYYWKQVKDGSVIYSNDPVGGDERELFAVRGRTQQFTTDGKFIVAGIWREGVHSLSLYRFNLDGSNKTQLTGAENSYDFNPHITRDGNVLFDRGWFAPGNPVAIFSVPLTGGETEKIELDLSHQHIAPILSPDGKYLAYVQTVKDKSSGENKFYVRVVEFESGKAGGVVFEKATPEVRTPRWTPESDAITYAKHRENGNLFKLTLASQIETQISDFTQKANTGHFVWSPDGKRILALRSTSLVNLVLIKDVTTVGN